MSSFPDVLSAALTASGGANSTFTVPATYAFAVVQVCLYGGSSNGTSRIINTSHGSFSFDSYTDNSTNGDKSLKDYPILNLIIKGGESFSLSSPNSSAKITALCHKKPS